MHTLYLRALEIQGFKSFPDKTRLTFEKDITAIVGPNGSGKSNISDALLWVMGEQRSKTLRGGKMEDVIFGGTEKRSPMGFAQVSLVLDNSGHMFDVDCDEVTITRRYYRSGESEYYINREAVRLRDVTELLMDTGLGRDGYSVIGQGRIAEIVSAKSTDRREIFEEAAGIARYRRRKEEAERKLEHTDENLLRINDKIDELEMQVEPLRKQADTAKKFLILRDEQRSLEISVWMETLDRLRKQSETVSADYENARNSLKNAETELEALYAAAENFSSKMRECDVQAEKLRESLSAEESAASERESGIAVLKAGMLHSQENVDRLQTELGEQADRAKDLQRQLDESEARLNEIAGSKTASEIAVGQTLRDIESNAEAAGEAQRGLKELISRENAAGETLAEQKTMMSVLSDKLSELSDRTGSIDRDIVSGEERYDQATAKLRESSGRLAEAKNHLDEVNNVISGRKMLMSGREQRVSELTAKLNSLTVDRRSAQSRAAMLEELEKEFEGMGKAVKNVMRAAQRGSLRGVFGPVAGLLSVDERYTLAIETALGGSMQDIVVDTPESGKAAIEMLKRSDGGRCTFRPLSVMKPNMLRRVPDTQEGYLGVASALIKYDKKFENIFLNLLGRTVVAETLGDAVRISKSSDGQLRIVTLDGQLINAGGSMTGGSVSRNAGILSRANELKKLRERCGQLETACRSCEQELEGAKRELEGAKYELEVASAEQTEAMENYHRCESENAQCRLLQSAADEYLEKLEAEKTGLGASIKQCREQIAALTRSKDETESELRRVRESISLSNEGGERFERRREELAEKLSELRSGIASLDAERDATYKSRQSLMELLAVLSGDEEQRVKSIAAAKKHIAELDKQIEEASAAAAEHHRHIDEIKAQIEGVNALRLELEGRRTKNEKAAQDKNRELMDMQSVCAGLEQKKLTSEMEESQIVDKLWESYELSRSAAEELRQPVENMPQAQKRISELRREISRLGSVNIGAIEEYDRVSERYNFLSTQRNDVDKAKKELEKIISDITTEMKDIFSAQFKAIAESFRGVFLDLFGGGKASLELEDESNVLECGIEIKVQPPGKAVTTISLLSGGEKSFVAIALYFAIMKVRPTPFCIMDEIDAALDEANVARYADYMRSMADKTQFIAITHHRATMEEADMLYGVTMQEKGVTTVISVDLEEAERSIS